MAFTARASAVQTLATAGIALLAATAVVGLVAGLTGAVPPLTAVALVCGPTAVLTGARLISLAVSLHVRARSFAACRGAGFLGVGTLAAGLTAVALPMASEPALAAGSGLVAGAALLLLGLVLLPGVATSVADRLRRALDGLSIGVIVSFSLWLLRGPGAVPPLALMEGLATAGGLAVATVVAVRAAAYRPAALRCGAGAAAVLLGLCGLAVPLAYGYDGPGLLVAGAALLAGPPLSWAGASRAGTGPGRPAPGAGTLAGYPLLTVPVGLALIMALYHLITRGAFDRTAMVLGLAGAGLLSIREALSAADVRRYARRLAGREAHFRSLVAGANDLILVLDDELVVRWQSPAAARLFGLSDADVLGHPVLSLLHPDDRDGAALLLSLVADRQRPDDRPVLVSARLRDGFGRWRDTESTVSDQRDVPEVGALVLHLRDVGERRQLEQQLFRMSFTDQLTSLPNRRQLMRALEQRRTMPGHGGALLAIDLQGLGAINDERGREVGDAVLVEVARRLRAALGPDDLPARLGGDEFGVITPSSPVVAYGLGIRLLAELTRPYQLPGAVVILHASVGLTEVHGRDGSTSADDVLQRADLARRRAQQLGRDRLEWYDSCLEEQLGRRMDMERELAGAIGRGELDLVFQPVVHLLDRRPAGVEALLRWRHRELGTVLPAELMPVAEDLGISGEIGEWVVRAAARYLAGWLAAGNDLWLSVNMSPDQLTSPDFVSRVGAALAAHAVPPERLVVEISETRLGRDLPGVVAPLAALRDLGVRTALDDFGAGQDSLAQLRRLPIDLLKIDGALVSEPGRRHGPTRPLVDVVVSLGRRLGLELIAEGLESRTRLDEALNAGCRLGQGFLLGRPMPAEHLEAYLEDHRTPSF